MTHIKIWTLILGLTLLSCNPNNKTISATENKSGKSIVESTSKDKEEIQKLIKKVLTWADSKNSIELLPINTDSNNSIYIGFNLDIHRKNIEKLKATNFFAAEFIDNYDQIILTLDTK